MRLAAIKGEALGGEEMFGLIGAWSGTIRMESDLLITFKRNKPFFLILTNGTKVVLLS